MLRGDGRRHHRRRRIHGRPPPPKVAAAAITAAAAERARGPAGRFGRGDIDAVHRHHLQAALAVGQVADNRGARRHIAVPRRLQGAGVTEGVAAIVERDESVTLCGVEPLHLALRRCLRNGLGLLITVCHANRRHCPMPARHPKPPPVPAARGRLRHDDYRKTHPATGLIVQMLRWGFVALQQKWVDFGGEHADKPASAATAQGAFQRCHHRISALTSVPSSVRGRRQPAVNPRPLARSHGF